MSESIVKFSGDTTTRELWDGGPKGSTGLSRILNPGNSSFSMVTFQQAKPLLDSELNLSQQIQNKARADILRALLSPGILSMTTITDVTDRKNALRISNAVANVNGWLVYLNGQNRSDALSDIVFSAAPYNGSREDLAYVEVWFEEVAPSGSPEDDDENVYRYGGIASGTIANDLQDSVAGDETTRRIQLRWNIRTVTDVNFTNYPKGVDNGDRVKARAGAQSDTNYTFGSVGNGLYRAGDGSSAACTTLKCVDGYVYALPLFRVHRRNQTAYDATDNKEGAPAYSSGTVIPSGLYHNVIAAQDVTPLWQRAQPYGGGNLDALGAALADAETLGQVCWTELDKWRKQKIQQGKITLYNKFVVAGCVVGAVPGTRNIQITRTGTYDKNGYSLFFADGQLRAFDDVQSSVAAVPVNTGTAAQTYYSYLLKDGDTYKPHVDTTVPAGAIRLYRITVPAGNTGADLSKVGFADERRVETNYSAYYNSLPFAMVTLPGYTMPDAPDYGVDLEVESASGGLDTVGQLRAVEKGNNGFKIVTSGTADNIVIRWTLINPDA